MRAIVVDGTIPEILRISEVQPRTGAAAALTQRRLGGKAVLGVRP